MKHRLITLSALTEALISTTVLAVQAPQVEVSTTPETASASRTADLADPQMLRDDICWVAPEWLDD